MMPCCNLLYTQKQRLSSTASFSVSVLLQTDKSLLNTTSTYVFILLPKGNKLGHYQWLKCWMVAFMNKCTGIKQVNAWQPFIFNFTFPLTAGVVGAPQMNSQPVSSNFLCSPLPSGTWQIPGLSIPWCNLFPSFDQTWWMGGMSKPLQLGSLFYGNVFVWSDCLLDLGIDFLNSNVVFS